MATLTGLLNLRQLNTSLFEYARASRFYQSVKYRESRAILIQRRDCNNAINISRLASFPLSAPFVVTTSPITSQIAFAYRRNISHTLYAKSVEEDIRIFTVHQTPVRKAACGNLTIHFIDDHFFPDPLKHGISYILPATRKSITSRKGEGAELTG